MRALDYLAELGLMELEASQVRHAYRIVRRPDDLAALGEELYRRTLAIENRELERLGQVLELAALDGCRWNSLCAHFGEIRTAPCGHCSWCRDGAARPLPAAAPAVIDEAIWQRAQELRRGQPALASPRAFTRFLTGLSSPRLSRARLGSNALFGALAEIPFARVLARVEEEGN